MSLGAVSVGVFECRSGGCHAGDQHDGISAFLVVIFTFKHILRSNGEKILWLLSRRR